MKSLYPAEHKITLLTQPAIALKISRHSHCSICSCPHLRPASGVQVFLDDAQPPKQVDQPLKYLDSCNCGHDVPSHGADVSKVGEKEYARRSRVAVRLDEILQDAGRLLDFEYTDEDIRSLRRQMTLCRTPSLDGIFSPSPLSEKRSLPSPSSTLSDLPEQQPPLKRRRLSPSASETENKDEDEDEDEPLAVRTGFAQAHKPSEGGHRPQNHGKGLKSKSKGLTSSMSIAPPTGIVQAEMNGQVVPQEENRRIKVEDKLDESRLNRLATGVTVDTCESVTTTPSTIKPEKSSYIELRKGVIQIISVENDGQPRSRIILAGLKKLFQKQLPKMPREYIARLVFDLNSKCLAIIKRGYLVVGAICYRPFRHRGFAEIVFFATNSADQEKGYGGMLMNYFKNHIRTTYPDMMHFLTYADNYAVGYFKKQGFSKDITLQRSKWAGYIKDYEGGTIMQCTMLPKVNYLETRELITQQREAVMTKIREISQSHIVHPGLPQFLNSNGGEIEVDYKDVPGLRESGWTPDMSSVDRAIHKSPERIIMERLLSDLQGHSVAWAFQQPVNGDEVPDYYDVIKEPMDLSTMEHKLETSQYLELEIFLSDAQLVFDNCRTYNPEGSIYAKNATKLEKYMKDQLATYRVKQED